jgi:ABC-type lipoprotein release transport system permease subunit
VPAERRGLAVNAYIAVTPIDYSQEAEIPDKLKNIDGIMSFVNWLTGGGAWDPSIRGIYRLPAKLQGWDVARSVVLALGLSFIVTIFPARRAARMNPVEALRYE